MLELACVVFWTIAYSIILWNGIKYRHEANMMMPFLACIVNFAWEINAIVFSRGLWSHVIWLGLDIGIFLLNIEVIWKKSKEKKRHVALYLIITVICVAIQYVFFQHSSGILITSFVVNLLVSTIYVVYAKFVSVRGKIPIAITKMLGTLFATLCYGQDSAFSAVVGSVILLLDMLYLACCFEEKYTKSVRKGK